MSTSKTVTKICKVKSKRRQVLKINVKFRYKYLISNFIDKLVDAGAVTDMLFNFNS